MIGALGRGIAAQPEPGNQLAQFVRLTGETAHFPEGSHQRDGRGGPADRVRRKGPAFPKYVPN
jgi:hypothetical protein